MEEIDKKICLKKRNEDWRTIKKDSWANKTKNLWFLEIQHIKNFLILIVYALVTYY